jgi:2-polyprenyl-3-methyl-5-hydroxy-6-metoxy-1,4-benzoquinol methylase
MSVRRVALVYDDTARPETTGGYCRRALEGLVRVEHFLPSQADAIPRAGFDLYLQIDDGLESRLPGELRPCAWWAIDTHLNFDWCLAKARDFDLVFAAQRDGAERLRQESIATASWLPLACDPSVHARHDVPKRYDVCFVGNVFSGPRSDLLRLLQAHFRNTFVGRCYFEEMARAYSAARVVFNRSVLNDVNMRVFEAAACGSLLLTNDLSDNGQAELFRDGMHLATYRDAEELLDKVRFYLARDEARERIAAAGRAEALARHTYRHRMEALLAAAGQGRRLVPVAPADPAADPRDAGYFEFARPELLALVPATARRVLDVGCGAGRLGEAIKARQQAEVVGIECDERAARAAVSRLDRVLAGDAEALEPDFGPGSFDAVVCGDVLEHMADPEAFLRKVRAWLAPGGVLVASVPNVRHHSVVSALVNGNWTYETAGLLDRTHLHFFTRRDAEELFSRAGFRVRRLGVVPGPGYDEWQRQGQPGEVRVGRLAVGGLTREEAEEFYVYQYLVTAEPAAREAPPPAPGRRAGPMRFRQDFVTDFDQVDFRGEPFAFVRFGDGERAICMAKPLVARDGWEYPGGPSRFGEELLAALRHDAPDYYVGISDSCCDRPARDWYLGQVRVPLGQVTFANLFVNGNYRRFQGLDLRGLAVVASEGGDFRVPADVFAEPFDLDALVARLLTVDRPILVAAGPASPILIHKYWTRAVRKQTIVDVGSAIDERTKGRKTRPYQVPGTRQSELVCSW